MSFTNEFIDNTILPLIDPNMDDTIYIYNDSTINISRNVIKYIKSVSGNNINNIHQYYSIDYLIEGMYDTLICIPSYDNIVQYDDIYILTTILQHINENGRCLIALPDNFLLSENPVYIDIRKYLLNNFNIEKIYSLNNRTSLLYLRLNGYTTSIDFHDDTCNSLSYNYLQDRNYVLFDDTDLPELISMSQDDIDSYYYTKIGNLCNVSDTNIMIVIDSIHNRKNLPRISIVASPPPYNKNQLVLPIDYTKCSIWYIYYYLKQNMNKLEECYDYITNNLILSKFFDIDIIIPSSHSQYKYIDICKNLYNIIRTNYKLIKMYIKQKQNIIQSYNINSKNMILDTITTFHKGELLTPRTYKEGIHPVIGGGVKKYKRSHYNYNCNENTILCLSMGKYAGYISINDMKVWSSTSIAIIPSCDIIDNTYLSYYLKSIQKEIYYLQDNINDGIPYININKLSKINILVPSLDKQFLINNELKHLDDKIKNLITDNKILKSQNVLNNILFD